MKRVDPFFMLILVLFGSLIVVYKAAQYDLSGLRFQVLINEQLRHQIQVLELKQKELELTAHPAKKKSAVKERSVASISPDAVEQAGPHTAEFLYKQIAKYCDQPKKEIECIDQIEAMISQYPETKWSGKSLLWLSQLYSRNNRHDDAREILKIVRQEFRAFPDLMSQLGELEKSRL